MVFNKDEPSPAMETVWLWNHVSKDGSDGPGALHFSLVSRVPGFCYDNIFLFKSLVGTDGVWDYSARIDKQHTPTLRNHGTLSLLRMTPRARKRPASFQ